MVTGCKSLGALGGLLLLAAGTELRASLEGDPFHPANLDTTQPARSFGIVKGDGRLTWPAGLLELARQNPEVRRLQQRIDGRLREALEQSRYHPVVNSGLVKLLQNDVGKLGKLLRQNVQDFSFQQYVEAKRFLNDLDTALNLMRRRR
jgi:hypothetical protein